jgi:hypothetical protein
MSPAQSDALFSIKPLKNNKMVGPEGLDRAGVPAAAAARPIAARFDLPIMRSSESIGLGE